MCAQVTVHILSAATLQGVPQKKRVMTVPKYIYRLSMRKESRAAFQVSNVAWMQVRRDFKRGHMLDNLKDAHIL